MRPKRDINAVLRDHDQDLLALPGVVGIYVSSVGENDQPCLKVMLDREVLQTKRTIPKLIEGYPVVCEVTGEVRPYRKS